MISIVSAQKNPANIQNCTICKYEFISTSPKYYCCQINEVVCKKCRSKVCNTCKQQRTKLSNIKCITCNIYYSNENQTYYYFKTDTYQCYKCLSYAYIFYYQQAISHKLDPKIFKIDHKKNEDSYLEELIIFFKNWCMCCKKGFKDNAFQMILGARICSGCLEVNFDKLSKRLISCIQCGGYMRDTKEIYFQFSNTQVYCIYCANLQKQRMGSIRNKEEVLSSRLSNNSAKNSQAKSSKVIPAVELSGLRVVKEGKNHQQSSKLIKAISKFSIEQQSLNQQLIVQRIQRKSACCLCLSKIDRQFLLTLTKEDQYKVRDMKQVKRISQDYEACLVCIEQLTKTISKQGRQIHNQSVSQMINKQSSSGNFLKSKPLQRQQQKILSKAKSKDILESHNQHSDLKCIICQSKLGQLKTQKGFVCLSCHKK